MNDKEKTEITPKQGSSLLSFDEFDNLFSDFMSRRWPRLVDWNFSTDFEKGFPKVDIIDRDKVIEIHAALPGVKKEDLEVTVSGQSVCIKASTKKEEKKEEDRYFRREIASGEFMRTLALPENADGSNAKASFSDGILTISVPKTAQSQRKNIEVS